MDPCDILDPVVERTRQAREALAKECDYDLKKMADLFRAMEAEHPERVVGPGAAGMKREPLADVSQT